MKKKNKKKHSALDNSPTLPSEFNMPNCSGEDAKCTVFSSSGMIDLSFLKCLHKICSVKVCALYWVDITGSNQQDFDIF